MVRFLKRLGVLALVGLAVLAFTVPAAHGQGRPTHVRPGLPFRQSRAFGFDPFSRQRFDRFEDRFERRFPPGRFDRFEDRFERRLRFDPFPQRRFGFDPFFGIEGFGF